MNRILTILMLAMAVVGTSAWAARAHAPGVVLTGVGTATIDGVLSPGEWDNAGSIDVALKVPVVDGGGTTPAVLLVMNDANNLYLAMKIARASLGLETVVTFSFDSNHNGVIDEGEDFLSFTVGVFVPANFVDNFWTTACSTPLCALSDTEFGGGTTDGAAAGSNDGSYTYIEISHPLNSGDTGHDFSLTPGSIIGFNLLVFLGSLDPSVPSGELTFFPSATNQANGFGDIVIASITSPVGIDVKPGVVNPRSHGKMRVAVLSTPEFDAPADLDRSSLTFGRTGDEVSLAFCNRDGSDVNGDGLPDLICHFDTTATGFQPGDTQGVLKGHLVSGIAIVGTDSVRVVPAP
jgi:hypothetical protein